jgi:hypothetical protein
MCHHLQSASKYRLTLYTRNRSKALPILAKGATWTDSPRAVAEQTDVVITMVGLPRDVREVYFGEQGVLAGVRPGMVLIDMTTTEPSLAQEIALAAQSRGTFAVDAPVSGGDVGARNATLSIMVGGDDQGSSGRHAATGMPRQKNRTPGRVRARGNMHEALQSNRDRRHHDRRLREPALRVQRPDYSWIACWNRFAVVRPPVGRWRIWRHVF